MTSLLTALTAEDPGGVRLARGLHLVIITFATGVAAYALATWLGIANVMGFTIIAGAVAGNAMILMAQGTRRAEAIDIARLCTLTFLLVAVAALVGLGGLGFGNIPVQIAWLLVIAGGLYCRRFGAAGMRYGMMASFFFMIVMILNPTRAEAMSLLLAVAVAGVMSVVLHAVLWRPSALRATEREGQKFLDAVAQAVAAPTRTGGTIDGSSLASIEQFRHRLDRAAEPAAQENPQERTRLSRMVAKALQIMMAFRLLQAVPPPKPATVPATAATPDLDQIRSNIARLIAAPITDGVADDSAAIEALRTVRDRAAADPAIPWSFKFSLLRELVGLLRVLAYSVDFRADMAAIGKPESAAPPVKSVAQPAGSPGSSNASAMAWRLALQGLVAAGITVALNVIFQFDHGYWATMTVFVVLSNSLGATVERSIQRGLGTALGVVVAICVHGLIGGSPAWEIVVTLAAAAPILVVFDRHYLLASALIGFVVVMVLHLVAGIGTAGIVSRLYETLLGIAMALLAARFVFPIRMSSNVRPSLETVLADARAAVTTAATPGADLAMVLAKLRSDVDTFATDLANLDSERFFLLHAASDSLRLRNNAYALADAVSYYCGSLTRLMLDWESIPAELQAHEEKLKDGLIAELAAGLAQPAEKPDFNEIAEHWAGAESMIESVPGRDAILIVETFHYGRKSYDALEQVRTAFAGMRI